MELAWVYLRCSVQMQETLGSLACSKDKSIETDFGDYELIVFFFQACQWHLLSTLLSVLFCCFVLFVIDSFHAAQGALNSQSSCFPPRITGITTSCSYFAFYIFFHLPEIWSGAYQTFLIPFCSLQWKIRNLSGILIDIIIELKGISLNLAKTLQNQRKRSGRWDPEWH